MAYLLEVQTLFSYYFREIEIPGQFAAFVCSLQPSRDGFGICGVLIFRLPFSSHQGRVGFNKNMAVGR